MNRRGDVATIMLFVATVVLVVAALGSFVSIRNDIDKNSNDLNIVFEDVNFYQRYLENEVEIVYWEVVDVKGGKEEFKRLLIEKNLGISEFEGFFDKVESGDFDYKNEEFLMRDIVVSSGRGANKVDRKFDIIIGFN